MIHKFKAKDINILLDVNSGGVHIIDDITYDLLDEVKPPFEKECPDKVIAEISGRGKTILAAQVTVMGNMKAHCLDRRHNCRLCVIAINIKNWPKSAAIRNIMSGGHIPDIIWIFQRILYIYMKRGLTRRSHSKSKIFSTFLLFASGIRYDFFYHFAFILPMTVTCAASIVLPLPEISAQGAR